MKFQWHPYFDKPADTGGGTGVIDKPVARKEVADSDTEALDNLLGDTGEKEEKEEDLLVEPDEDKEQEDKEEEQEEDEDLINPEIENNRGIDLKRVKEKYPEFAKTNEFRELRNAYHREAEYTSLFPTIDDAKEAAENNETYNKLNDALVGRGDVSVLLTSLREADPAALKKVATGFLDAVAAQDQALYVETISPVIRRLAKQIKSEGEKHLKRDKESIDGQALVATARNIMQYAFDDPDGVDKDEPSVPKEVVEREKKLTEREQAIAAEKYHNALSVATTSVERHLDKIIVDGLDPDNTMNEFTRDTLLEKIKNEVKQQVANDQLHVRRMNSLWKRAEQSGYSRENLSRIVAAYLERARSVIPTVRNKYRGIALKGRQRQTEQEEQERPIRIRNSSGKPPSRDGRQPRTAEPKKIDYKKTSDLDIMEGKLTLK